MKVCVFGLWHLGTVTAACLAEAGIATLGLDVDRATVDRLSNGRPPLFEPQLEDLVRAGLSAGTLQFTASIERVAEADLVWVAFDTPVNDADEADFEFVVDQVLQLAPSLARDAVVLISSQVPAGTTRRIAERFGSMGRGDVSFAYSPENLRLGRAIDVFKHPERIVIGCVDERARSVIEPVVERFSTNLIWMSAESAEVVKHGINAFLALSIVYANEMAAICEKAGADIEQVEIGLRSEPRIGEKAYVRAGAAFAGGTLARDVRFLSAIAATHRLAVPVLGSILASNDNHRKWPRLRLQEICGSLTGKTVAVLGLTYKPGTNTLRRSSSIELCEWLFEAGARVRAFDPSLSELPPPLHEKIFLERTAEDALRQADAVVVATEWPEFRELSPAVVAGLMRTPTVIDQNRHLGRAFAQHPELRYVSLGKK